MFFGRWAWLLAYELVATYMWIWCNGNMTAFPWCGLKVKTINVSARLTIVTKAVVGGSNPLIHSIKIF